MMLSCNKQETPESQEQEQELTAQTVARLCASEEVLQEQIQRDPARARALEQLEEFTRNYKGRGLENARTTMLYVPVVVNILLPDPNIVSDAQIASQIDVLTKDFTKANADLTSSSYLAGYDYNLVPNCQIQFVLKVVRREVRNTTYGTNDAVKKTSQGGLDPLNKTTHLNMWVCDLSSGLLGYAQFPGGSPDTDGVVIDYQAFGRSSSASYAMYAQFNLGRTATHEVGHWLNLRHIWGDRRCGDDIVGDTPTHDDANTGVPGVGHKSRCTGRPLEQWMNYMDYTDDRGMYMFSAGQKTRMDGAIAGSRGAYLTTAP
jgi:hypothetical protein